MDKSVLTTTLFVGIAAGATGALVLAPSDAAAQQRVFAADRVYRLAGDFNIQLSTEFAKKGDGIPMAEEGTAFVRDVDMIDLLDDWAVITKREATRDLTFIVPREEVIYIHTENR